MGYIGRSGNSGSDRRTSRTASVRNFPQSQLDFTPTSNIELSSRTIILFRLSRWTRWRFLIFVQPAVIATALGAAFVLAALPVRGLLSLVGV